MYRIPQKVSGVALIAAPFIGVAIYGYWFAGLLATAAAFATTATIVLSVAIGFYLIYA